LYGGRAARVLGEGDLPLLRGLMGDPAMPQHARDFEYPPGHWMRCNDWRLKLG
jgi:hypothetical protein